jgi:tetratricopeptide (TPR) repeat protein
MEGLILLDGYRPKGIGFLGRRSANRAIEQFKQALAIIPEHFQSLFFIGKLYQRLKDYENALTYFETALQYEHSNHSLPQEASLVAMHLHQTDKAILYSAEALRRAPENFALMGNHAMNLLIAGLDEEARETIDKAMLINQNDKINRTIQLKIENVISGKVKRPTFEQALG